jgi:tetratricopeptide (TPR) repeat protein
VQSHDWLADAYERRRDRDGASKQLKLAAQAQEKAGDFTELAETLERIIEIGGARADTYGWLARTRLKLKQDHLAVEAWAKTIDAVVEAGRLKEARPLVEEALASVPSSVELRSRLAQIANREGDRVTASRQFVAAADLASGGGQLAAAREMLVQACRLRADDLVLRLRLAGVAEELGDAKLDEVLAEVVNVAVRSSNFGIALEYARKRIAAAGGLAYNPRLELIELLRLSNDSAGQLAAGKQLLDDLLQQGEFEKAVEVLSRLVASHPKNSELVLQLAEVNAALGDERQAFRFYRHAIPLLQLDDKVTEAKTALDLLEGMCEDDEKPAVGLARERLERGQVVDWDKIRRELEQGQRRKAVGRVIKPGLD